MGLSKGKYAQFISDRSGQAFPYKEMVIEWNGSRVHVSEFEPKQPQLEPKPAVADGQVVPEDGSIANNKRQANMKIGEVQISIS